ncbi:MAG: DUF4461 domain-containing protein [Oligoflexia bacterium]|nr:DUF4461 domain-containing protein [Oligoflexia bacterium]
MSRKKHALIILGFCAAVGLAVEAYETDQFTVPPRELADTGPAFSRFIFRRLHEVVAKANRDGRADLWDEAALARAVIDDLGLLMTWQDQLDGVFGRDLTVLDFDGTAPVAPVSYLAPKLGNIYSFAGFHRLISPSYFVFSSTFRMFGVHLGSDKLGHFINQGYQYFELYQGALARGASEDAALAAAVAFGVRTEAGFFGRIVDGVYSNADLASNFAGMWFFRNLLKPIELEGVRYPPILLRLADGTLGFSSDPVNAPETLLQRFFTRHLDEALNPSQYERLQRVVIRREIRERCFPLRLFYGLETRAAAEEATARLQLWSGLDYGHRDEKLLRIADLCF